MFPPWFKKVYPQAHANFVHNTQYLSTPFDVHKTLESILNFEPPKDGDRHQRAISLFDKVSVYVIIFKRVIKICKKSLLIKKKLNYFLLKYVKYSIKK